MSPVCQPWSSWAPQWCWEAGIWGQPCGRWAEAPAYGSRLIIITAPIVDTKDFHAFPICFSEPCWCSPHSPECLSQPLWGYSGLSYNVTFFLTWLAELPMAPSPGSPWYLIDVSINTYHIPLLLFKQLPPQQLVVPSRQHPNFPDFGVSCP